MRNPLSYALRIRGKHKTEKSLKLKKWGIEESSILYVEVGVNGGRGIEPDDCEMGD